MWTLSITAFDYQMNKTLYFIPLLYDVLINNSEPLKKEFFLDRKAFDGNFSLYWNF